MPLLTYLLDLIFPPRGDDSIVRTLNEDSLCTLVELTTVTTCHPAATALLSFSKKEVRALIHEAKFRENRKAMRLLGNVLNDYITEIMLEEGFGKTVFIPLPLSTRRHKERGYNQSEEIAKYAKNVQTFAPDLLLRVRDTAPQTTLSYWERQKNMRGALRAVHVLDPSITYILFDDVLTTGATMQCAIDALTDAGALHIIPITLSH